MSTVMLDRGLGRAFVAVPGTRYKEMRVRMEGAGAQIEEIELAEAVAQRTRGQIDRIYGVIRNPNDRFVGWIQRHIRDKNGPPPRKFRQRGVLQGAPLRHIIDAARSLVGDPECPVGLRPQIEFMRLPESTALIPDKIVPFELLPDWWRTEMREYFPLEPYSWPGGQYKTSTVFLRGQEYDDVVSMYGEDWAIYRKETAEPRPRDQWEPAKRVVSDMEAV